MGIAVEVATLDQLEKFRARVMRAAPKDEEPKEKDEGYVPGDPLAMRGVPLVGVQGVGGVIAGTRPGDSAWRLAKDEAYLRRPRKKISPAGASPS